MERFRYGTGIADSNCQEAVYESIQTCNVLLVNQGVTNHELSAGGPHMTMAWEASRYAAVRLLTLAHAVPYPGSVKMCRGSSALSPSLRRSLVTMVRTSPESPE